MLPLVERLPSPEVRSQLGKILTEGSPELKRQAWEIALALPGKIGASFLEQAVLDAPPRVRLRAMNRLVEGGADPSRLDLLKRLTRDEEAEIRIQALEALTRFPGPKVMELMIERLATGEKREQEIAGNYLKTAEQLDPEAKRQALLQILSRGNQTTRQIIIATLLETTSPERVVRDVLDRCSGMVGWLRTRVQEALRQAGHGVLDAAVRIALAQEDEFRTAAIMMLAEGVKDPRLVEPFCQLLTDEDWWLRVTACEVLGNLGEERAVPDLVRTLQDEDARWAAIDALAQIGAPSALQPLSRLLKDPREELRLEVLSAFSRFSDQRLLPVIESVRDRDSSPTVSERAREILREMRKRLDLETTDQDSTRLPHQKLENPLDKLLWRIREMGASDLHLTVDEPPMLRLDGQLQRMEGLGPLSPEHCRKYILSILDEDQRGQLETDRALDFCHEIPGVGRYRANAFLQRRGICASFRVTPNAPPTFYELGLPRALKELLDYHQGIIVLAGPAGCGKSSSLTAMIDLLNETRPLHILTLEDPIEFVHPPKLGLINQRQVGRDTESFSSGLRAALREDPDVIVVGELRDPDTIRLALKAAETGHLVLATLHTTGAVQTIDRLVDSLPPDEQPQIRASLSESLKYVICQRLVPRKDPEKVRPGRRRVAVFEVIKVTFSLGNKIRKDETLQIPGLMQIGRHLGMRTRDMALLELLDSDLIEPETAWRFAEKPSSFVHLCDPSRISSLEGPR